MQRTTRSRSVVRAGAAGVSTLLLSGAVLLATAPAGAAPGASGIAEYVPPAAQTLTVPKPYDDLSSEICSGQSAHPPLKIQSREGTTGAVYALPGDTVQLVGVAKGCQTQIAPEDLAEFGFLAGELAWWERTAGSTSTSDLGRGSIVQEGRDVVPTISILSRTVAASDDGALIFFGTPAFVSAPNGVDTVGASTARSIRVIDPHLELTKQVCLTGTGCDATADAQWGPAATVAAGSDVQWRLTAKNTGNIALNDVRVSDDVLTGGTATGNDCVGASVVTSLEPGASAAITCTTSAVTGAEEVINAAKLTSTFTDPSGGRLSSRFTDGVQSNISSASVRTLAPAIALVKQVCATGTGCDIADDSQWTSRVTVPLGTDAQWRLTVTNTGNTTLTDVVPTQENLTGAIEGPSEECEALAFGTLEPGQKKSLDCTTTGIVDTTQDAVNHAVVRGMPADDAGTPYEALYPTGVSTPEATAAVATSALVVTPQPEITDPPVDVPPTGGEVTPPGLPPVTTTPAPTSTPSPTSSTLASTGLDATLGGAAAAMLLAIGGAVLVLKRRAARGAARG